MDPARRKKDAEKAGQAINKVIGTVVDNRNSESIPAPKNTKSKLKTRPLQLPSAVCQEMMLKSDEDLSKFPSHSSVFNTNLAIKASSHSSLKELQLLKTSRFSVRSKSGVQETDARLSPSLPVPKISRLHPNHADKSQQWRKTSLRVETTSTDSLDTIDAAWFDTPATSQQQLVDSQEPPIPALPQSRRGNTAGSRKEGRPPSRVLLDASKLIQPKQRPTSAVAAEQSHITEHYQNEAALMTSGPAFPHASTGRLAHAESSSVHRNPSSKKQDLNVVLVCHKLQSEPKNPNGRALLSSAATSRRTGASNRRGGGLSVGDGKSVVGGAGGSDVQTSDIATDMNESSWFGDGPNADDEEQASDHFAIVEEEEEDEEGAVEVKEDKSRTATTAAYPNNVFQNSLLEEEEEPSEEEENEEREEVAVYDNPLLIVPPQVKQDLPVFNTVDEVDSVLNKYHLLWKQRAKVLRNEAPSPSLQSEEISSADTSNSGEKVPDAAKDSVPTSSGSVKTRSALSRTTKSSGSSKTTRSAVSFKDSSSPSRPETGGTLSSKSAKTDSIEQDANDILSDAHESEADSFSRQSMIITSLKRLSENKKRKSVFEANSNRSSARRKPSDTTPDSSTDIQIPGTEVEPGAEAEPLPFPPFARIFTPENYAMSYDGDPVAHHRPRSRPISKAHQYGKELAPPAVLEDWYLDENGYSKESKKLAVWNDILEDRGPPVPIVPEKAPVPGLKKHAAHHHSHYPNFVEDADAVLHRETTFSCDPNTPPTFTEVLEAEDSFRKQNRPKYLASKDTFISRNGLNHGLPSSEEQAQMQPQHPDVSNTENESFPSVGLEIKGKSVHIVQLDVAGGSVALGLGWSPAPPKMSLPLKLYQHAHSVPETPRLAGKVSLHPEMRSIDQKNQIDEDDEDLNLSFSDMVNTQPIQALTKPLRIPSRGKTPLMDIPVEDPAESMAFGEGDWVQPTSIIAENPFALSLPPVIQEESGMMPVVSEEHEEEKAAVLDSTHIEEPELPAKVPDTAQHSEEHRKTDAIKKPRLYASDSESTIKRPLPPPPVKRLRSQSQPVKKKLVIVSAPPIIFKKKASKKSRIASTSSSDGEDLEPAVMGIDGSTMSLNSVSQPRQLSTMSQSLSQDPVAFYKKRRMSQTNQSVATLLSSEMSLSSGYGASMRESTSSFMQSMASSYISISPGKQAEKKREEKALYNEPVGPNWYELVHQTDKRARVFTPNERARYPTFNDTGPLEELAQIEGEQAVDPLGEIEKLTALIMSSNLPIPAFLRRRGILLGRMGRYDEAMSDLMKAVQFDPFNSDALWHRHQLYLRLADTDRALKDLDAITDTNKQHFGAFLAKARIYEELTTHIKMAIVNYSQIIRLKPDEAEGYYHRACLFESENEMVYANEDFRMVRQLDPTNEHAIHNLAVYSFQRQLWDDAIQAFAKLIKLNPENGQAYLYRGRANAYLAKWDESLRDLTVAIQLAPDRADVFFYRGCLLRERNRRKAIEDLSVSVLLDDGPTNTDAFYQRAMLYYKLKKYDLALIDYHTVVELDPTKASAWLNMGIIYMRFFNEHYRALDCFDKSIQHDPIQIRSFLCRGDLLQILHSDYSEDFASGNADKKSKKAKPNSFSILSFLDRAIRDYSKAIHLCPSDHLLYLYRGRLLLKQGKIKEATYDFYSAFELNPEIAQTFMQRALVLSFQRKYLQIIDEFNQRIKLEKIEDSSLYLLVAKARIKCDDNEGAIRDLAKALEFSRIKDPQIYLQKGICFVNIKDWSNAAAEFTTCINLDPQFAKAYYHRGVCKLHEGNGKGVADLDSALKLDPKFFEAYLSRASYHHSRSFFAEGIEDCNNALKLEPTSIRAHLLRGACNCKIHQYGLAIVDFTKAIQLDKTCHFAFYNRAVTYQLLEDYKSAIKDYSIVLLLCDDSVFILTSVQLKIQQSPHFLHQKNAYRNRGLIYWKQGDAENALLDLYAARDNFPGDARLHGLLALCLQKVGRTEESLEAFTSSIRVNQTLIEAYLGRGNVFSSIGRCREAKRDYARVIHLYPTCTEAYVNMAYTLQMEAKYQRSWHFFSRAIAVNPLCTPALEGRAVVNHIMKNYFGALMDICKAIEIDPSNAEYFTNRAVVHNSLGDKVNALNDNKHAIKLDPQYALAYFNLANLYFAQARWDLALQYYNKALEFDPDDDAAILNRGLTRAQLKDSAGALDDLNVACMLNPDSIEVYFNRAQLHQKLEQYEAADADYSMVLRLSPSDSDSYKHRGEVRGKRGQIVESMQDYALNVVNEK
ncbi:cytochrome c oxidase subunit 1 [Chytriomyces hyalinus]|nr:cytochrome c oxidase subunit 1 [Chytriomyces hyalinus]